MNLPNRLTILRILFFPIILAVFYIPYFNTTTVMTGLTLRNLLIFILFVLGAITDQLDGMIARKYNMITNFGKFADPLADKILVLTALLVLSTETNVWGLVVPIWIATIILVREFTVTGMRILAMEKGNVVAAGFLGKVKTTVTMVALAMLFLHGVSEVIFYIGSILLYLATVLTIASGVEYIYKNREVFKEKKIN